MNWWRQVAEPTIKAATLLSVPIGAVWAWHELRPSTDLESEETKAAQIETRKLRVVATLTVLTVLGSAATLNWMSKR